VLYSRVYAFIVFTLALRCWINHSTSPNSIIPTRWLCLHTEQYTISMSCYYWVSGPCPSSSMPITN
jgi:hypothetical protein